MPDSSLSTQLPAPPEDSAQISGSVVPSGVDETLRPQALHLGAPLYEPSQAVEERRLALRSQNKGKHPTLARPATVAGNASATWEGRYHLRRTPQNTASTGGPLAELDTNVASPVNTPKRKRDSRATPTPQNSRKRMKSSKSRTQIDVGDVSPSPAPEESDC